MYACRQGSVLLQLLCSGDCVCWIYCCKRLTEELLFQYFGHTVLLAGKKFLGVWVFFGVEGEECSPLEFIPIFLYSHLWGQTVPPAHSLRCLLYMCWGGLYTAAWAQGMAEHGSVGCPQRQEPAVFTILLMFESGKSLLGCLWTPVEILTQCHFENPATSIHVWKCCSLEGILTSGPRAKSFHQRIW